MTSATQESKRREANSRGGTRNTPRWPEPSLGRERRSNRSNTTSRRDQRNITRSRSYIKRSRGRRSPRNQPETKQLARKERAKDRSRSRERSRIVHSRQITKMCKCFSFILFTFDSSDTKVYHYDTAILTFLNLLSKLPPAKVDSSHT